MNAVSAISCVMSYPKYSPEKQRDQPVTAVCRCLACRRLTARKTVPQFCSPECYAKHKGNECQKSE